MLIYNVRTAQTVIPNEGLPEIPPAPKGGTLIVWGFPSWRIAQGVVKALKSDWDTIAVFDPIQKGAVVIRSTKHSEGSVIHLPLSGKELFHTEHYAIVESIQGGKYELRKDCLVG